MALSAQDEAVRDLREIIRELPTAFLWMPARGQHAQHMTGVRSSLRRGNILTDEGGFIEGYAFSLAAPLQDFSVTPTPGDRVDVDNIPFRIGAVVIDEWRAGIRMDLQNDQ